MQVLNSIHINAPIEKVWDALVNPTKTKIYMFGCEAKSDWNPGSTLLWEAEIEGKKIIFVTGKVLEYKAPHVLRYTVFDPNKEMEDIPANHLIVTYNLEKEGEQTILTVIQNEFEGAALGRERYEEAYNNGEGWNPILEKIALLVEDKKA